MLKSESLENEIDAERLEKRKESQKKIIISLASSIIIILLIIGISFINLKSNKGNGISQSMQFNEEAIIYEKTPVTDANMGRESFKDALKIFEEKIEHKLLSANLDAWAKEKKLEIQNNKRQAISEYSSGEYTNALQYLGKASVKGDILLKQRDVIFDDQLSKAISAYQLDQYKNAKLHISNALQVNPSAQNALDIENKIDALPIVLQKLQEAKIARVENNFIKELDILSDIVKLSPQRNEAAARIVELKNLIKQRSFTSYISQGLNAIDKGNIKSAKSNLKQAKAIYPNKSEVALLSEKIIFIEKEIRAKSAIKLAIKAVKNDDWLAAKNSFLSAQKDAPNNQEIVSGLQKSNNIISLKSAIKKYLQKPLRLSNAIIGKSVKETLTRTEKYIGDSPSLIVASNKLRKLLKIINIAVEVTVHSDNTTFIQVKTIGKIGMVQEKTIKLKPGNYIFEGMREGYKSKLVKVKIPYDKPASIIKVICDEPI